MIRFLKKTILFLLLYLPFQLFGQQKSSADASILVDSYSLEEARIIPIGILIELDDDWHIYWRNPGDSGMPTTIDFDLPDGLSLSEIKWPVPTAFEYDGLASFGYKKHVLLLADLFLPEYFIVSPVEITAILKSLICKDVCIPFNKRTSVQFNIESNYIADDYTALLFNHARKNLPQEKSDVEFYINAGTDNITIVVKKLPADSPQIGSMYFLPYENGIFKNSTDQKFTLYDNQIELVVDFDHFKTEELKEVYGIIIFENLKVGKNHQKAYEIRKIFN